MLEARIATLEEKVGAAHVIDAAEISTDAVDIGSVVHVKDEKTGKSQKFTIVGSAEANPTEQRLSNESPVGKALIGHTRGPFGRCGRQPALARGLRRPHLHPAASLPDPRRVRL